MEDYLANLSKNFPQLPKRIKEIIVRYIPLMIIVFYVSIIPSFFALTAFHVLPLNDLVPRKFFYLFMPMGYLIWGVSLIAIIMRFSAIKGLEARKLSAWRILFYATLISAVGDLVASDFITLIVSLIISLYFLFQIKDFYIN